MEEVLKAKLTITRVINGEETPSGTQEVELALENIPGAWMVIRTPVDTQNPDQPGVGEDRLSAVADWFGRNFGKKLEPKGVCELALKTVLNRMDRSQIQQLAMLILANLDLPKQGI